MKRYRLLSAMRSCGAYKKLPPAQRDALRSKRLTDIVAHAKVNSPYYASLYRSVDPAHFSLTDLPPVSKATLMENFDAWLTDRSVTLAGVQAFMENLDNIGRKYMGKYLVYTTSGSTGLPLVSLYDGSANAVMGAVAAMRSFARAEDLSAFVKRGGRTIGVFATGGFYLSNVSVRSKQLSMPWKRRQIAVTSALLPTQQIVQELNAFQPAMLGGYPSNLALLIPEAASGRLSISPVLIMTGGEYLSPALREQLSDTFHCYVQTSYGCTEGGTVACECREQHFHINDDWLIVEPVDSSNRPVPDGVQSDKLLLTNLFNGAQPFIRYEVTDRIVLHRDPCPCGNPSPWITIEGRTDDIIVLDGGAGPIRIPPLAAYATLKEVHALMRFQLVVRPGNRLLLRFEPAQDVTRESAFAQAQQALLPFVQGYGVQNVTVLPSDELPMQHPKSGKYKHIICEEAD